MTQVLRQVMRALKITAPIILMLLERIPEMTMLMELDNQPNLKLLPKMKLLKMLNSYPSQKNTRSKSIQNQPDNHPVMETIATQLPMPSKTSSPIPIQDLASGG